MFMVACRTHSFFTIAAALLVLTGCPREGRDVSESMEAEGTQEVGTLTIRPQLLECTPADNVPPEIMVVDAAGATLRLGGHELVVPANAVPAPTRFTLAVPTRSEYAEVELTAVDGGENPVIEFETPLVLTISYGQRCPDVPGPPPVPGRPRRNYYSIYKISPDHTQFIQALGGGDNKNQRRVTTYVNHLSRYAVATN